MQRIGKELNFLFNIIFSEQILKWIVTSIDITVAYGSDEIPPLDTNTSEKLNV